MNGMSAAQGSKFLRQFRFEEAVEFVGLAIIWTLLWEMAKIGGLKANASLWYPPSALTLAILFFGERKHLFLAFVGPTCHIFGLNSFAHDGNSLGNIILFYVTPPLAHVIGYYIGANILRKSNDETMTLSFIARYFCATITGALIAALLGSVSLKYRIGIPWNEFGELLIRWWAGDFVGAITLTPLLVILLNSLSLVSRNTKGNPFTFKSNIKAVLNRQFIVFFSIVLFLYFALLVLKTTFWTYVPYSLPILVASASIFFIRDETGIEQTSVVIALFGFVSAITASLANKLEFLIEFDFFLPVFVFAAFSALVIKNLRFQNISLEKRANHDALTGLLNRGGFQTQLHALTQNLGRRRLCYAIFDLDHFKDINDQFGHPAGDEALQKVACVLKSILGNNDNIGRIGGEEFAVIIPGLSLDDARQLVNNVLIGISRIGDLPCQLTASAGLIQVEEGESESSIFQRADLLLYDAKASGRNCARS